MAIDHECYVDTSAFIALRDRSDHFHPLFRGLFENPPILTTSALVVAEAYGWFLRRYGSIRALEILDLVKRLPALNVVPFGPAEFPAVTAMATKFHDQRVALADAHGLAIMSDRRIRTCWSTDRHLGLTGVPLVITVQ